MNATIADLSVMGRPLTETNPKGFGVLSSFGKGAEGSRALNFARSGGAHCDSGCQYHPEQGGTCYAVRIEVRPDRAQLADKLARHEATDPAEVADAALAELRALVAKGKRPIWFRVSASGSVPNRIGPRFRQSFGALLDYCRAEGIPVHLPIETTAKAARYRRVFGDVVAVRESVTSADRFLSARSPVSVVIGEQGTPRADRIAQAQAIARRKRRQGRRTIVCPAIVAGWKARARGLSGDTYKRVTAKAKCGTCDACSRTDTDIVYPLH